jgi:hypothetical protein
VSLSSQIVVLEPQTSVLFLLQFGHEQLQKGRPIILGTFLCASQRPKKSPSVKIQEAQSQNVEAHSQNVDLPHRLPKKKKKPYPIPFEKIKQAAREDKKFAQLGIEKPLDPPKNGLLVPDLIPVAYEVVDAWKVLIKGLAQLLHIIPVNACRYFFFFKYVY